MPAPEVVLKSLTGHPTALDQTLGCMTGLFHIFEGNPASMGRRYSSTRMGILSGQAQLRTQTDRLSHRHDRNKVGDTQKKAVQSTKQHHRSHSDVRDIAMIPSRTLTDFRTLKDEDGYGQIEPTQADSEGTVDALAFYNESLRAAALFAGDPLRRSDLDQREYSKRNVVLPKARLVNNDASSSDIRDAILASFQRETERPKSTKATSDQSLNSTGNQGSLENRRDGCQKDRKGAVSRKSVDLPRSSSVYARSNEPSELVNWKEGLRNSASPPRKLSHHNSPEKRIEPKKDRGRSLSRDHYPFACMSPKRFPGSQVPSPQDRRHVEILNQHNNFKESPGACDFRESLRPFLTGVQERQNVPAQVGFESRLANSPAGVSHQMTLNSEESVVPNVIARLMGLEEIPSSNRQSIPSSKVPDAKSRGDKLFRGLLQFDPQIIRPTSPPPPPPCQSKKFVDHQLEQLSASDREYGLQEDYDDNYPAQYKLEEGFCSCEEDKDYERLNSKPFLPFEDEHREVAHPASGQLAEPGTLTDSTTQAKDTNIITPEKKKKIIRKILDAMRPKAFLKISRRKQTEQEKSPVTKLIINDAQPLQELLEKQQQTTQIKVTTNLKLPGGMNNEEPPRYATSDSSSVKQVQEQQTDSCNSSESSVVKPCILQPDEKKIVVMKPSTRFQDSNASITKVRHVETASSTSTVDKEMSSTRRTAQVNNEDWNPAKDQRRALKPVKPRVAADIAPRSTRAKSTLESDYESDPSNTTQNDKSNNVRESKKIRTTKWKRIPSSKSLTPDIQRQNGRCLSPEDRPSSRSSPREDNACGTGEVGRKSVVTKANRDSKTTPTNFKAQIGKEETLKKRVTENPDVSRLCGSSTENKPALTNTEKPAAKEIVSIRSAGARASSPAAPRKLDVSHSSITVAVTLEMSDGSNSAPHQPASAQTQTSDSEPVLEYLGTAQPEQGRFKDSHVNIRHASPELEKTKEDSVSDHCVNISGLENLEACSIIPDDSQPLLQAREAAIEVSEELTTPRGVPFRCENLDGKLDELDRPSPISVLDTKTFEEELTPSPSSPRYFPVLQDSETTYNDDGHESCNKDLEAYHETPALIEDLNFDGLLSKCAEGLGAQVEDPETKNRLNKFQPIFKDAELDEERAFAESFPLAPKGVTSCTFDDSSVINSYVSDKTKTKRSRFELTDTESINENLLESLQSNGVLQENNHLLLLDCLEEIMERVLESQSNLMIWAGVPPETICERTKGKQLEQELWIELQDIKRSASSEDICEIVHILLQRDLIKCQGRQWSTFNKDREQVVRDMETMIVEDLIEEAVKDLCALERGTPSLPIEATRRQLFTT